MSPRALHRLIVLAAVLGIGVAAFVPLRREALLTAQTTPQCGNGLAESPNEECDDGNADNTDRCTTSCRLARCGDGFVQQGEGCDDGNTNPNDGCNCMTLSNNAQCIGITAPSSVTAGQSFAATVTMKNTGTKPWNPPNHYLYDVDWKNGGFTAMRWGTATAQLPMSPVAASATAAFAIAATAPAQAGSYTFQWAMLENGVGYFGVTCTKTITVTAASTPTSSVPTTQPTSSQGGGSCGDGYCDRGSPDEDHMDESCFNCPQDCGACSSLPPPPSSSGPVFAGRCRVHWLSQFSGDPACNDADPCTDDLCLSCSGMQPQLRPPECLGIDIHDMDGNDAVPGVCRYSPSPRCRPYCGNGRVDPGEECDDNNVISGDGCSSACKTEVASACRNGRDDADRDADADCADFGCIDPDSQVGSAVRCDPDGTTETDLWDTAGDTLPNFFDLQVLIRNPSVEVQRESSVSSFFRRLLGQAIPPAQNACVEAGGIVMESTFRISNNLSTVDMKKNSCAGKQVSYTFPQKISSTQDALSARGAIAQGCYSGVAGDPIGGCYGAASTWMRDVVEAIALGAEKPTLSNGRIHRIELEWCRADCVCQGAKDDATDTKRRIQDAAKAKRDDVQAQYSAMLLNTSAEQINKALEWSRKTLAEINAKEKEDLDALQQVMDGAAGQCFQQCMTGQRLQTACPAREPDCCSSMCISNVCPVQRPTAVTNMRYISLCQYLAQVALPCGAQGPGGPGSTIILPATSSSSAPVPTDIGTSSSVVSDVPDAPPVSTASAPPVPVAPPTSQGASSLSVVISARSESSSSRSSGGSSVRSSAPASVVFSVSSVRQSSSAVSSSRMSSAASVAMQRSSALLSAVCPPDPCANGGSAYCGGRAMLCVPLSVLPCFSCTAAGSVASSSIRSVAAAFSVASAASSKPAPFAVPRPPPLTPPPSSRPPLPPLAPPIPAVVATLPTDVLPALVRCGDGRRDGGEECDDGNLRDFDGCSGDCFLERGICGDDTVQSLLGEQCEPSSHDVRLPYGCSPLCRFTSALCGNGQPDPGEECDGSAANSDAPNAYCRTDCGLARCGDRIVDAPTESCDDGNRVSGDGCSSSCASERAAPATLAAQVFSFPLPRSEQLSAQVSPPLLQTWQAVPPAVTASGPGTLGVMAAGAAAGVGWARRRRTKKA